MHRWWGGVSCVGPIFPACKQGSNLKRERQVQVSLCCWMFMCCWWLVCVHVNVCCGGPVWGPAIYSRTARSGQKVTPWIPKKVKIKFCKGFPPNLKTNALSCSNGGIIFFLLSGVWEEGVHNGFRVPQHLCTQQQDGDIFESVKHKV